MRARRAAIPLLLCTACVVSGGSARASLPPSPPVLNVTMREYRFDYRPTVERGRVVVRATNAGTLNHELVLVALPEDFPPVAQQVHADAHLPVVTLAVINAHPPGTGSTFAVNLVAGRYAFLCFVKDPDGVSHDLKGMTSEFRVQ